MSFFARNFYDDDLSFAPVFRFIDAFDDFNRSTRGGQTGTAPRPSFNPKFDVVETKSAYELHGEIPGVDRKDLSIEFTEPQTIVIHGKVERKHTSGTPPTTAGLVEGSGADSLDSITEGGSHDDKSDGAATPSRASSESHRATVTDEETEAALERGEQQKQVAAPASPSQERQAAAKQHQASNKTKYWCQERSIGEFHRTFSFPVPVDEAAVTASLSNGVLHVTIPKQEKRANRRIDIV